MKKFSATAVSIVIVGMTAVSPTCYAVNNSYYAEEQLYDSSSGLGALYFDTTNFYANYSENSYNYGTFLDENNVQVYMEMMKLINPSVETVTVKLPNPIKFTVSTLDNSSMTDEDINIYRNTLFSNCRPGIDCALFDIPELFWIDLEQMGVNIKNYNVTRNIRQGNYTIEASEITFTPAYYKNYGSLDGVMEYKQKLADTVADFPVEGNTRYEQLKSIHDYICSYTFYDIGSPFASSAVGALVEPGAVCEAYAEGFKLICDSLDIPCVLVVGNFSDQSDEAHMWNYVRMEDGKWYAVDLTWDDLDGYGGKEVKYQYFLKGADTFLTSHTPSEELGFTTFIYPELAESAYVPETTLVGDVNHDGKVNMADLVYCTKTVLAVHKPVYSCDVDNDGTTDAFDLVYLRKILLGLI